MLFVSNLMKEMLRICCDVRMILSNLRRSFQNLMLDKRDHLRGHIHLDIPIVILDRECAVRGHVSDYSRVLGGAFGTVVPDGPNSVSNLEKWHHIASGRQ